MKSVPRFAFFSTPGLLKNRLASSSIVSICRTHEVYTHFTCYNRTKQSKPLHSFPNVEFTTSPCTPRLRQVHVTPPSCSSSALRICTWSSHAQHSRMQLSPNVLEHTGSLPSCLGTGEDFYSNRSLCMHVTDIVFDHRSNGHMIKEAHSNACTAYRTLSE
jgi:hypothetical protein